MDSISEVRWPREYLRDPVSWLLVVTAVAELLLGNKLARGVPLFAGAALIIIDRARTSVREPQPAGQTSMWRDPDPIPVAPVQAAVSSPHFWTMAVLLAAILAFFPPHSWPLTLVLGVIGMLAIVWAARTSLAGRDGDENDDPSRSMFPWLALFLALGVWEMIALAGQKSILIDNFEATTISSLVDPFLESYPGRFIGILLWISWGRYMVRAP